MRKLIELNFENVPAEEFANFKVRDTVRAVVFDEDNNIALVRASGGKFHKVPGGGVEDGEKFIEALKRECLEEAGVTLSAITELGCIKEIRSDEKMVQNSYCYLAHVAGKKQTPIFTESERANDFKILWVRLDEAINLIKKDGFSNPIGKYVRERELLILTSAQRYKNKRTR